MNRRDFLRGLAALAVIRGTIPPLPAETPIGAQAWFDQWMNDCQPIWLDYYENTLIYGVGALRHVATYPYIESVHPKELTIMPSGLGLFQQA